MLPKSSTYVKIFGGDTKWKYDLIEDDDFLKIYNVIWNKVRNRTINVTIDSQSVIDSKPIYNIKILKTKIKSYGYDTTDFHDKKIPEVGFNYTYLAAISIDFVPKKDESDYLQVFLKERKYTEKEKRWLSILLMT